MPSSGTKNKASATPTRLHSGVARGQAQVSLTTLKRIEKGDISYFDSLMRVLRILDVLSSLIKEDEMSPNEYFEFVEARKKKQRKRATGNNKANTQLNTEESGW